MPRILHRDDGRLGPMRAQPTQEFRRTSGDQCHVAIGQWIDDEACRINAGDYISQIRFQLRSATKAKIDHGAIKRAPNTTRMCGACQGHMLTLHQR